MRTLWTWPFWRNQTRWYVKMRSFLLQLFVPVFLNGNKNFESKLWILEHYSHKIQVTLWKHAPPAATKWSAEVFPRWLSQALFPRLCVGASLFHIVHLVSLGLVLNKIEVPPLFEVLVPYHFPTFNVSLLLGGMGSCLEEATLTFGKLNTLLWHFLHLCLDQCFSPTLAQLIPVVVQESTRTAIESNCARPEWLLLVVPQFTTDRCVAFKALCYGPITWLCVSLCNACVLIIKSCQLVLFRFKFLCLLQGVLFVTLLHVSGLEQKDIGGNSKSDVVIRAKGITSRGSPTKLFLFFLFLFFIRGILFPSKRSLYMYCTTEVR